MLLQKGGKQVYFGDLHYGKTKDSRKLIDYFEERSGQKCTEDDNPAEFILDVSNFKYGCTVFMI